MRGVFPILVTPFDERERVDEDSLRSLVDFNIGAGVHGLGIALGSEIQKLTEPEREQVIRIVVDQTRGRVPVVVNTGAQANLTAVLYSRQAVDLGAAAVMCLPPAPPVSASEMRAYFKAISDAVSVPVFIQDTQTTPVPAALIRRIADDNEQVRYAKVESPPQPTQVQAAVQASGGLVTVFGGAGGTYLLEELRRGSVGTMPWPSQPEAFVRIWDVWQAGDQRQAAELHEREIAPLAKLATAGIRLGHTVHKELLRRRGVIRSSLVRAPSDALDEITRRELDAVCDRLGIGNAVA
ncbi:MAG TPA: dihydrodipicolinate synthase family protein [Chloroflexota bacterium]|nr:dihydrodipicolinate synthase family protein [Chloroflexota bacterium]